MDGISLGSLAALLGSNSTAQYVVLGLIFATVVLVVVGVSGLVAADPAAKRMRQQGANGPAGPTAALDTGRPAVLRLVAPLEKRLTPEDAEVRSKIRLQLVHAGYMSPGAISNYYASRILLALALPLAFTLTIPFIARVMQPSAILVLEVWLGVIGWVAPTVFVKLKAKERIQAIRNSFPDALDLLLVCVEAGLGLDQAIARVGEEMTAAHPELAEQFRISSLELRAGRSREDALRNLGVRCGVEEISAFVTLLIQTQELGTSVGDTLRVYADDMRNVRLMKAEEKAAQLPVKLSIPLVLFMLPAFLGTLMVPVVIRVIRVLLPVAS